MQKGGSKKEALIESYLTENEVVSYTVAHNPTGMIASFFKEIAGREVTTGFVTNRRIIEYRTQAGGFEYTHVQLPHVTSIAYTRELDWTALISGIVLLVLGIVGSVLPEVSIFGIVAIILGLGLVAYAFLRSKQHLSVRTSNSDAGLTLPVLGEWN